MWFWGRKKPRFEIGEMASFDDGNNIYRALILNRRKTSENWEYRLDLSEYNPLLKIYKIWIPQECLYRHLIVHRWANKVDFNSIQ